MAEPTEMQQMEMDMVAGMYDTYALVSEAPPSYSVELAASADHPAELRVTVLYPSEDYPDTTPCQVTIESIARNRRVQVGAISAEVATLCEENVGMHTVLMALQHIQDFLVTSAEEAEKTELARRGAADEAAAMAKKGPMAADPTIRLGTAVTKELFAAWSQKRMAEKQKLRAAEEKKEARASASTLTGRQLWDSSLKQADWDLFGTADGDEDVDFGALDEMNEDDFDFDED